MTADRIQLQASASTTAKVQLVRDIMSSPVQTVNMDDSILDLKNIFDRNSFHHMVVVERHRVVGVVSDRDVLKSISPFVGKDSERAKDSFTLQRRAHQIMSREPITIGPDDSTAAAAEKMITEKVSCLPVVDEQEELVGIITVRDLAARVTRLDVNSPPPPQPELDEGVLIMIDGVDAYHPALPLARAIRAAHKECTRSQPPLHPGSQVSFQS